MKIETVVARKISAIYDGDGRAALSLEGARFAPLADAGIRDGA
jgi:hypothetical protein